MRILVSHPLIQKMSPDKLEEFLIKQVNLHQSGQPTVFSEKSASCKPFVPTEDIKPEGWDSALGSGHLSDNEDSHDDDYVSDESCEVREIYLPKV
mmetsp:Transcript_19599/g.30193  ORF Transcript_19599/g.30193 Transcript_19599/m.30193 type:complete len:95 (+) Transcript_19599:1034-1318(+)